MRYNLCVILLAFIDGNVTMWFQSQKATIFNSLSHSFISNLEGAFNLNGSFPWHLQVMNPSGEVAMNSFC